VLGQCRQRKERAFSVRTVQTEKGEGFQC